MTKPGMTIGTDEEGIQSYVDRREEIAGEASKKLATSQDGLRPKKTTRYKAPKPGDLVLLRDFQQAKDKGKKWEPRWSSPRILERISKSGVSAHVRQLHEPPGSTKRFHFNDLLLYTPRSENYPMVTEEVEGEVRAVSYERGTMGDVQGVWRVGQRVFDVSDIN